MYIFYAEFIMHTISVQVHIQGGSKKSKLLYCVNSLLFLSHPVDRHHCILLGDEDNILAAHM